MFDAAEVDRLSVRCRTRSLVIGVEKGRRRRVDVHDYLVAPEDQFCSYRS